MCLGILSPNFNLRDLKWFLIANDTKRIFELEENLVNYMYFEYNAKQRTSSFEVPMYFLQGDSDWITPTVLAEEYYQSITAPDKAFLVMPGGHTPFLDNPDVFAIKVKQLLKP